MYKYSLLNSKQYDYKTIKVLILRRWNVIFFVKHILEKWIVNMLQMCRVTYMLSIGK